MNWKRFAASIFALLAVVLMSHQPLHAQANVQAGSIQGVVTDPQGGVVPNAKVTISNKDTGATLDTTTTSAGTFVSGSLVPGNIYGSSGSAELQDCVRHLYRPDQPGFERDDQT